jgi:hypothetical protein
MKLHELDTRDHQLDELSIGKTVGKAAGNVAKGVGAVAGGIAGLGSAFKKGWQAGKATTSLSDQPGQQNNQDSQGSTGAASDASAAGGQTGTAGGTAGGQTGTAGGTAGGQTGTAGGTAGGQTGTAGGTAGGQTGTAGGTAGGQTGTAGGTASNNQQSTDKVSELQARISKLDANSQKDIIQLLQKQSATAKEPAAEKPAATQDDSAGQPRTISTKDNPNSPTFTGVPERPAPDADQSTDQSDSKLAPGAFGKMAQDLTKPLAGANSETPGKAVEPTQPAAGDQASQTTDTGTQQDTQTTDTGGEKDKVAAKKSDSKLRDKATGRYTKDHTKDSGWQHNVSQFSDSKNNPKKSISESNKIIKESFSLFRK